MRTQGNRHCTGCICDQCKDNKFNSSIGLCQVCVSCRNLDYSQKLTDEKGCIAYRKREETA